MWSKLVLVVCITVAVVALSVPLTILVTAREARASVKDTLTGAAEVISALLESKTTVSLTANTMSITPISEIAMARQTVRITNVYKRIWMKSECVAISEQEFTVKYGYDTNDVFRIIRSGGEIVVPDPKILSIEPLSGSPKLLFDENGTWNNLKPGDMIEIGNQMYSKVRDDAQVKEFRDMLKSIIYSQLKALQTQWDNPHGSER